MQLTFRTHLADRYTSQSQRIRVLSEDWVSAVIFCPNCGNAKIDKYPNNRPVADFHCIRCNEEYELKSKEGSIGSKIVDGAFSTMLERLTSSNNPNFFLLSYDVSDLSVRDFLVIPKHFFVPGIIEKRKPLAATARCAGWVGCNIALDKIPQSGKIFLIRDRNIESKEKILTEWSKTLFLRDEVEVSARGWLLDTMFYIEKIGHAEFMLDEMYAFENELKIKYPNNRHIKDKLRQQLQVLRDKGYLEFTGRGHYKLR